jgi:putative molybdenum carrier protein
MVRVLKVVSGGQTGVDRAALDAAIEAGIPYGGWCPKEGWAEDLPRPPGLLAAYPHLRETPLAESMQRTEWNVRDADHLMVLIDSAGLLVSKGSEAARDFAATMGKPHIVLDLGADAALARARAFLGDGQVATTLCIAGPRESEAPGVYAKARKFLCALLGAVSR